MFNNMAKYLDVGEFPIPPNISKWDFSLSNTQLDTILNRLDRHMLRKKYQEKLEAIK